MLLYINKRLMEFKEDLPENIAICNTEGKKNFTLKKESKGFIFRDEHNNSYRPHFKTVGMAINNALCNGEIVTQKGIAIPSVITQVDPRYLSEIE